MKTGEYAFERWRDLQPFKGATDRERAAFLAGFRAATNPIKTVAQLEDILANGMKNISNEEKPVVVKFRMMAQSAKVEILIKLTS